MTHAPITTTCVQRWMPLLISIAVFSSACAWAAQQGLSHHEETFVFAGTCPNGEPYRLVAYQKHVAGLSPSFYDYEGPAGKGTVQSDTDPKIMAVRVCRRLAEIINTHYWE